MVISSRSPGKLYIAGEYAVVEKGYPAILIAVDQFIKVSLKKASHKGSIQAFDNTPIAFKRVQERLLLDYRDSRLSYLINSIKVVEALALEMNIQLELYDLSVESELENIDGKKYGLGSSAAVTVSTIKVLCKFYKIKITDKQLFKLAAIVHFKVNSNGSGGDLAASIYGGFILFKTFDKDWLLHQIKKLSISELIQVKWPYLEIKQLQAPNDLKLLIGWTKKPASTTVLVDKVRAGIIDNEAYYLEFLEKSKACVNQMVIGFENNDTHEIQKQININRKLLTELGQKLNVEIETATLAKLCEIALQFKGAAKSSGAGGGDCGIAIFKGKFNRQQVIDNWAKQHIVYLPLNVYKKTNY